MTNSSNKLGRYQIIREIARSNDIVYEAVDPSIGRRIALKELQMPANLVGGAKRERVERFYREAKAAGALTHPNIVTIFEVGEEAGRHFIAMEFLEGNNLQDAIEIRGGHPAKEAVDIMLQILEALDYAHSKGIIHRDIKPANIQLLPGGTVKLTDFGIARITHEPSITTSGQIFGTPSYMSPEQVAGKDIDPRSDIFSAGVVLYEALTGKKPFTGDSVVSITYNIMNTAPERPQGIPDGLVEIVMKAMAKNPEERFRSSREMIDALKSGWDQPQPMIGSAPGTPPPIFFPPTGPQQPPGGPPYGGPAPGGYGGGTPYGGPAPGTPTGNPNPLPNVPPLPTQSQTQLPSLPTLSDKQKAAITTIFMAVLLGGALLLAIWGINSAWQNYQLRANDAQANEYIQAGINHLNQQDYQAAIRQFEEADKMELSPAVQKNVKDLLSVAYWEIGQGLLNAGNPVSAMEYLNRALQYDPNSGEALFLMGEAYLRLGQGPTAISYWEQAMSRAPDSSGGREARQSLQRIYYERAEALYRRGDLQGALNLWQEVVKLDAGSVYGVRAHERIQRAMFQ